MATKQQDDQVQGYPLAPPMMPRSDAENANHPSEDLARRKRKKRRCLAYLAVFAVVQIVIILVVCLTVLRAKTPKLRLDRVEVRADGVDGGALMFSARVLIRNRNFGRYKFDDTYFTVRTTNRGSSGGGGQFMVNEGRARARSTKKIGVIWDMRSSNSSSSSNSMDLMVEGRMRGKVEVLRVFKRRKWAEMRCSMTLNLPSNAVQNLRCN